MYGKYFQHFMLLTFYLLFARSLVPAGAEEVDVIMATLRGNPKLAAADKILADFERGAPETPVIVTLRPSKEAKALEDRSRSSLKVPSKFTGPGAAPFYNLQDDSIRSQLEATVAATVGRVLAQLGPEGITVTRKFSYLFGFAATVTPAALARIVALPDVICVEKDQTDYPHPAPGASKQSLSEQRSVGCE